MLIRRAMRQGVRFGLRPVFSSRVPLLVQRSYIALAATAFPRAAGTQDVEHYLGGVLSRRMIPASAPGGMAVMYLHGGGYVLGSPATHAGLVSHLARAAGCECFVVDYRLAPEHPAPAALDDAVDAWAALTRSHSAVALAGDSAGGGLALATAIAARDRGLPAPRALALISPWADLSLSGLSMTTHATRDPMLSRDWLACAARHYAGSALTDPRVSPLFAELGGLPPTCIDVGSEEVLFSDAARLEGRLREAGVPVQRQVWNGLWHDFQLHAGQLQEADSSIAGLGGFLRKALTQQPTVADRSQPREEPQASPQEIAS
ncbi:alpha/beta hydrolase [Algiphilus sp.]|uniref:alpha/beta hydrolase n=1 Tax=Algiphilus sp. TaxID=1872431 RepID=UPI001CA674DB|nr:alpha/beta hydrolase [Algiphilus sp.]MBY8964435.1 alpha/beta hydrolase [Algiphilus acroporae]MCI5063739.1 alpha/beta hydrolase [Algiphilus sp.]MCI5103119.1 alpha/beta hydrolase [Algiphilus sp.]MCK5771414.1 alpha/beta hydrolase [Algiphilus sp.]